MKPLVVDVNVNLTDIVTPKACSFLVCELIKHLVYQREQIPYTYDRLKYLVTKRKELLLQPPNEEQEPISLHTRMAAERHYSIAEEMFTSLESALQVIRSELEVQSPSMIDEVLLVFGSTPIHAQNVFRIPIPFLGIGHKEESHPTIKHLPLLYQALVSSDGLNQVFNQKLSPTNIFIMLKMKENSYPLSENFFKKDHFNVPMRTCQINFLLNNASERRSCGCRNQLGIPVFCDTPSRHCNVVGNVIYSQELRNNSDDRSSNGLDDAKESVSDQDNWFQFNSKIKGFKDFKVEGMSVANLWLKFTKPYNLTK